MDSNARAAWTCRLLDVAMYAVVVTATVFVVAAGLSVLLSGYLVGRLFVVDLVVALVVRITFVVGFLVFGYSTFLLRPSPPWKTEYRGGDDVKIRRTETEPDDSTVGDRRETRFQAAVQRVPPLRWHSLPPDERLPPGLKLFVSSVAILAASYLFEQLVAT